jgi:hypothetical protein
MLHYVMAGFKSALGSLFTVHFPTIINEKEEGKKNLEILVCAPSDEVRERERDQKWYTEAT